MNHYVVHPKTVYADTSAEPSGAERAAATWPMTDRERDQFGTGIEGIAHRYSRMTKADIERALDDLGGTDG